jgi:hypothetical protein
MNRQIIFKQMFYDSQPINGKTAVSFFTENTDNDLSVTSMTEDIALRWLFQIYLFKQFFLESFFKDISAVRPFFGLTDPFVIANKKPGDIDLLLINTNLPNRPIAFECKRVKATSIDGKYSKVNNAQGIKEGTVQINKYQSLGFYKSYLMIILLDDSRQIEYANTMMRRSTSDNVEAIYEIPWNENLHDDVGVVYIKVTQPTGKNFNLMGGIGICIDKLAKPLEQTAEMNAKVMAFLKSQTI